LETNNITYFLPPNLIVYETEASNFPVESTFAATVALCSEGFVALTVASSNSITNSCLTINALAVCHPKMQIYAYGSFSKYSFCIGVTSKFSNVHSLKFLAILFA
jgi:hypothetical protein